MRTKTPLMAKKDLYIISDHWNVYKEGMFIIGDEEKENSEVFALRPMTCPFQYYVYKQTPKSYRDLPCRYGETSTLFRNRNPVKCMALPESDSLQFQRSSDCNT